MDKKKKIEQIRKKGKGKKSFKMRK